MALALGGPVDADAAEDVGLRIDMISGARDRWKTERCLGVKVK